MTESCRKLREKSFAFAVRIVKLVRFLEKERSEWVLSKQVMRSGTSVGANVRESRFAQSEADYVSKLSIALKEADETGYWLDLLHETDYITAEQFDSLNSDLDLLIGTLVNIVKASKRKFSTKPSSVSRSKAL